jgi:hypothetical protein
VQKLEERRVLAESEDTFICQTQQLAHRDTIYLRKGSSVFKGSFDLAGFGTAATIGRVGIRNCIR